MQFIYFVFRILFFYFLFVSALKLIIFLVRIFFAKKNARNQSKKSSPETGSYSKKENIIDVEFEEIE
jgi:hypothetical protein